MKCSGPGTKILSQGGALLFETFVALMVLSVGITGSLRVFSGALVAGERNAEAGDIREAMENWFFEQQAVPGASMSEGGIPSYTYLSKDGKRQYRFRIKTRPLPMGEDENDGVTSVGSESEWRGLEAGSTNEAAEKTPPDAEEAVVQRDSEPAVSKREARRVLANGKVWTLYRQPGLVPQNQRSMLPAGLGSDVSGTGSDRSRKPAGFAASGMLTVREYHNVVVEALDETGQVTYEYETVVFSNTVRMQ